jgi:hypothetical protein
LHRSRWTRCGPGAAAPEQPPPANPAPDAASNAAGVPGGRSPTTFKIGSTPLGTLRLASTPPFASTTASWQRLRCTPILAQTDTAGPLPEPECHPEHHTTEPSRKEVRHHTRPP